MNQDLEKIFFIKNNQIEDVQFWSAPEEITAVLKNLNSYFNLEKIEGFAALEAKGFFLAGLCTNLFLRPSVLIRKHKSFFEKMNCQKISFKNWKGEMETISIHLENLPKVKRVLLVDDILETGASLSATYELLKGVGIELVGAFYLLDAGADDLLIREKVVIKSLVKKKLFTSIS